MRRKGGCTGILLALAIAGIAGCGSGEASRGEHGPDWDEGVDLSGDLPFESASDANDPGARDAPADGGNEVIPDIDQDPGSALDPGGVDPGVGDEATVDPGVDTGAQPGAFCHSFDDCKDDEVCEFSLGLCQRRGTWIDAASAIYAFHPAAGAPGDLLAIDGTRFFAGGALGGGNARVQIGTVAVNAYATQQDENRILVHVTSAMKGVVKVFDSDGRPLFLAQPFQQAPAGVIPCDGTTPAGTGVPGDTPRHVGPYAAGYVDLGDDLDTRVFYPAECGSIRRPPVAGTWPLVMILHGNGAIFLNHEHLAQLLATWGFVSVMPSTMNNMANEEQQALVAQVMPLVARVRGRDLGDEHAVLAGVRTTEDVAWVGHSRGTGRSEELIQADSDLQAHTKGAIFLGPVDDGDPIPGLLMVFGAGHDAQSGSGNFNGPYDSHDGPRWLVFLPGGNHGSFCDHKVYGYGTLGALGDQKPDITRHRQLAIVETFGLPMMQRAFGLDEPFASTLDQPPAASDYTVKQSD